MGFIEGTGRNQALLSSIDDLVKEDSVARIIDLFVDTCNLENLGFAGTSPANVGRPSYNPAQMLKLYVYGYHFGVRSSRMLEAETYRNIEVMWLMDCLKPDFKTIADFRKNNLRALQKTYHTFVRKCNDLGLIGGELVAVDGTKIKASNNKKKNFNKKKLEQRLEKIDEYLKMLDEEDLKESQDSASTKEKCEELETRKATYEEYKQQLEKSGATEISIVDPDSRLIDNNRGGVDMAYNVQSAVDSKHHIIVECDVSLNSSDQHHLSKMVKKIQRRLKLKKFTVLADKGYYNGEDLARVKKLKVKAIVSRSRIGQPKDQPPELHTEKFIYDYAKDQFTCPMGKILYPHSKKNARRRNFFNKTACRDCPYLIQCTKGNQPYRVVTRGIYSKIQEETDKTFKENKDLYKLRQRLVEHPFGTIKHTMHGGYFLLRTRRKVCGEFALLALGYNLKRVLNVLGFKEFSERLQAISV